MAQVISAKNLLPGDVVRQTLYTRQGIRLLAPGTRLTSSLIKALRDTGEPAFVLAAERSRIAEAKPEDTFPARIGRPSLRRAESTLDSASPAAISALIDGLALDPTPSIVGRGRPWAVRYDEVRRVRSVLLREAESIVARRSTRWSSLPLRLELRTDPVRPADGELPGWLTESECASLAALRAEELNGMWLRLLNGQPVEVREPREMADEILRLFIRHPRRFAQLAWTPAPSDSPSAHAWRTAVISVGATARLGASPADAVDAGLLALLADCALPRRTPAQRPAGTGADDFEVNAARKHVVEGVALLDELDGLPERLLLAAYQHHERPDGTGYPRGLRAPRIHDLAMVVSAASDFCERAAASGPAAALAHLRSDTATGRVDRLVGSAILRLVGVHPIGTRLQLSDGRVGTVLAAGAPALDAPLVQLTDGSIVDLGDHGGLRVARLL